MTPLEDIPDLEGWVRWQVGRFASKGRRPSPDEFEEMCAQGVLILYEIHEKWDSTRCAPFHSHAERQFQRRMIDWYRYELRSSCKGHVPQVTKGPNVGRRLDPVYHGMTSLDLPAKAGETTTFAQDRALVYYDPGS